MYNSNTWLLEALEIKEKGRIGDDKSGKKHNQISKKNTAIRRRVTASGQREGHGWAEARARGLLDGWAERSLVVVGAEKERATRLGQRGKRPQVVAEQKTGQLGRGERRHGWAECMARLGTANACRGWSGMFVTGQGCS
ncbi:hypothetical protein ACFE04_004536 [Oxalis oulophora]